MRPDVPIYAAAGFFLAALLNPSSVLYDRVGAGGRDGSGATAVESILPDGPPDRIGEGTRRRSIAPGDASLMARVLIGECARCGEAELKAIAGVIFNRWQSGRYGPDLTDVLLYSNGSTFAFTAVDPAKANGDLVWGQHAGRSKLRAKMLRIVDETWQAWPEHDFSNYWHPDAMQPKGRVPRWAQGRKATRIGGAVFVKIP